MAVVVQITLRGVSKAQYDKVRDEAGWIEQAPDGGLLHLAWWEGEDCIVVDGWESDEAFGAFSETRLGPALGRAGVNVEPEANFHVAHEVYAPVAVTLI